LSTATARYSTHPLDVDNRTLPLMSTSVDISTKRVKLLTKAKQGNSCCRK